MVVASSVTQFPFYLRHASFSLIAILCRQWSWSDVLLSPSNVILAQKNISETTKHNFTQIHQFVLCLSRIQIFFLKNDESAEQYGITLALMADKTHQNVHLLIKCLWFTESKCAKCIRAGTKARVLFTVVALRTTSHHRPPVNGDEVEVALRWQKVCD